MIVNVTGYTSVKVWKQERLIARLTSITDNVTLYSTIDSVTTELATYTPSASGEVLIDLTDYVRTYPDVDSFRFAFGGNSRILAVTMAGLINPDSVIIPANWEYAKIVPPTHMIAGTSGTIIAEFYDFSAGTYAVGGATWVNSHRGISVTQNTVDLYCSTPSGYKHKVYVMRPQQCGVQYALVRWVSFSGATRTHYLELVKAKTDAANNYSLMPTDNEYIDIKGRVDGFSMRLDGLDAYDTWYYADMLFSSKVEVSLDGGTTWAQVQVTSKSITLPDGDNADGKFVVSLNWKRYDAVAL